MAMSANRTDDTLTTDEREEALERRLAELEFIRSAYSPEEAWVAEEGLNDDRCCCSIVRQLHLSCTQYTGGVNDNADAAKMELSLGMPDVYPVIEDATLIINGSLVSSPSNPPFVRKAALLAIPQLVDTCRQTATELAGMEAVFSVLARAEEWVDSEWEIILEECRRNSLANTKSASNESSSNDMHFNTNTLGRRIFYSHHIIANSKRRDIANLTSQYKLGGYMKIGWPGVILIEGDESNCLAFADEIKRWRWQHLSIRAEEQKEIQEGDTLDSHRQLPIKFKELGEDGMSLLASNCREAGLERLFLTCMKINDHRTVDEIEQKHDKGSSSNVESTYGVLVHVDHMNDGKRYRKWLRKSCQAQGCFLLIRQCVNTDANEYYGRPTIYVGIFGDKEGVRQVMKLWRISRVDVDSKNKPCLERMMTVIEESDLSIPNNLSSLDDESGLDCSFEDFERLISTVKTEWTQNLRNRHAENS